jgi:hypothetical protein
MNCPQKLERRGMAKAHLPPGSGEGALDLFAQLGRCPLVVIQRKDPLAAGAVKSAVLLRAMAGKIRRHVNRGAELAADFHGTVGAAGIHHHDLVGPCDRLQAAAYHAFGVLGGDDDREPHLTWRRVKREL